MIFFFRHYKIPILIETYLIFFLVMKKTATLFRYILKYIVTFLVSALLIKTGVFFFKENNLDRKNKKNQIRNFTLNGQHINGASSFLNDTSHSEQLSEIELKKQQSKEPANVFKYNTGVPDNLWLAGLKAHQRAQSLGQTASNIGFLIDYSQASDKKRMWVVDFSTGNVLLNTYVAHGKGSGDKYATSFSNQAGSHQSSLGVYLIKESYYGSHGKSLKVQGLEPENNMAYNRAIVMHSANYMSPDFIANNGRAGRSFGCFALPNDAMSRVLQINNQFPNSLLVAYYPDKAWLSHSQYV